MVKRVLLTTACVLAGGHAHAPAQWTEPVRLTDHMGGLSPRAVAYHDTIELVFDGMDFFHLRSTDGGRSWSDPSSIADTLGFLWPGDIIVSAGETHVAWVARPPDFFREQIYHRSSSDGGATWSAPHHVFHHGGSSASLKYPRLAASGDTLFLTCRTFGELLFLRSFDRGESWEDSTLIETGPILIDYPPNLMYSAGRLHVVYQLGVLGDTFGIEIYHRYSDDYGLSWTERYPLSTTEGFPNVEHSQFPSAYADNEGNLAVAWFDYKYGSMCGVTGELLMRTSTNNAQSWLPETRITNEQSATKSSVLINEQEIHIIWQDWRSDCSPRTYYSFSGDRGYSWAEPERITTGIESIELDPFLTFAEQDEAIALHCFITKYWLPNTSDIFYLQNANVTLIEEDRGDSSGTTIAHLNYPNPFNQITAIEFTHKNSANVKVSIFDIRGDLVEKLFEGFVGPGTHYWTWNADRVATGIYFYELEIGNDRQTGKMMLIK